MQERYRVTPHTTRCQHHRKAQDTGRNERRESKEQQDEEARIEETPENGTEVGRNMQTRKEKKNEMTGERGKLYGLGDYFNNLTFFTYLVQHGYGTAEDRNRTLLKLTGNCRH